MIHIITFLVAHPDSTQDKMAAFVYNEGGALYSKQRISEHLDDLEITKKKASIEVFQASSAEVQFRVFTYWNCPPPLGIFKVRRRKLINIDGFGVTLKRCNAMAVGGNTKINQKGDKRNSDGNGNGDGDRQQ